jgi:peptide deformylase
MAFRKIIKYPDATLTEKSSPVSSGEDVSQLVQDLYDTLNVAGGVGLSAPQIGYHQRVIFVKADGVTTEMINPVILESGSTTSMSEGCLSFPGVSENILRSETLTVRYQTLEGETLTQDLHGLPAQVVQHEIDHLDGKLMIDHLSRLKRSMAKKRVAKVRKEVSGMMALPAEPTITRKKKNQHLSKKEIKKRRRRRKQTS